MFPVMELSAGYDYMLPATFFFLHHDTDFQKLTAGAVRQQLMQLFLFLETIKKKFLIPNQKITA